jgi:thiol-disulfide isomerase/thioredoxin
MKRFTLLGAFGFALLAFTSCEQDNRVQGCADPFAINFSPNTLVSDDDGSCVYPPEVRKALMYKVTATWCPPCGDWGTKEFHDAVDENKGNAVFMTLHASGDPMYTSLIDVFESDYGITGYPTLVVNHNSEFGSAAGMTGAVNSFITGEPEASAISIFEIKGNKAIITAQTRWFAEMTGQMYCAIYLLEDGIKEPQASPDGYINDYVHDYVFRASANGDAFGEAVLNGEAWIGKTENLNYEVTLDPSWNKSNLYAVTVLWRQGAEGKEFVNAYYGTRK